MSDGPSRRTYLDVLRGVAVLVMIEAHLLDSWTRFPDRQTRQFTDAIVIGGFGAPLFLFLAGIAVPLSAGSKFRRTGDAGAASRAVVRRGLEITRARLRVSGAVVASRAVPGVVHVQGRHPEHHGALDHGRRGDLGLRSAPQGDGSWPSLPSRCRRRSSPRSFATLLYSRRSPIRSKRTFGLFQGSAILCCCRGSASCSRA